MEYRQKSLIMCVTPLQAFIAEKIIKLKTNEIFDVIFVANVDNEKHRYYFEKIGNHAKEKIYFLNKYSSYLSYILNFIKFKTKINSTLDLEKYSNLYLASIDSRYFQYIISKNKKANVYTFDDGTANIVKNSIYYQVDRPSYFKRIIWSILGNKLYMSDIKLLSKKHYTIYKGLENIVKDTLFVSLFDGFGYADKDGYVVNIYLGQPLEELFCDYDFKNLSKFLKSYKIDYYYPHPREVSIPELGDTVVLHSNKIFEEYILDLILEGGKQINVYSYLSSTLINIKNIPQINIFYIHDSHFFKKYSSFYEDMETKFNIKHISIDSHGKI